MNDRLTIITTADPSEDRKKRQKQIIVTQDLSDADIESKLEMTTPVTVLKTSDSKDKKDEKETS